MKVEGGRPTSVRTRASALGPEAGYGAPQDSTELHSDLALAGQPLRNSASLPAWMRSYEKDLGVTSEALELRREALKEEGPLLMYRMFPLLFRQDLTGPYQSLGRLLPGAAPRVWLAGDAHLANFGTVRKPNSEVVWTLNDYDQGGKGRADYDLCRAGASLALLGRLQGWSEKQLDEVVSSLGRHYARGLEEFCQSKPPSTLGLKASDTREPVTRLIGKADKKSQADFLARWARVDSGNYRFQHDDRLRALSPAQDQHLSRLLAEMKLKGVEILDRAVRLDAGGSSMGLERFYLLARKQKDELPSLLEVKHVLPSALLSDSPDPRGCDADKLSQSFETLHAPRDPWMQVVADAGGVYLLRERQSAKDALKSEKLSPEDAEKVAAMMGRILAQAHAVQGQAEALTEWLEGRKEVLQVNLCQFSKLYAGQVVQDYQAWTSGR